jgi:RNase P subunit RPR2
VKITKVGSRPEDKEYRASCRNCKSEVEFRRNEAEYISDQRDGDFLSVRCPICGNLIAVTP